MLCWAVVFQCMYMLNCPEVHPSAALLMTPCGWLYSCRMFHSMPVLPASCFIHLPTTCPSLTAQKTNKSALKTFSGPSDEVTSGASAELKEKLVTRQQYVLVIPQD